MTVLEAYALGKPVMGARIGGIPEQILEGRTGVTFTSGDPISLAAAFARYDRSHRCRSRGTRSGGPAVGRAGVRHRSLTGTECSTSIASSA
jgi:glycosyltransferase involved in cell wall biosynthesis